MLSFPPKVAPTKVLIVPLSSKVEFEEDVRQLSDDLRAVGVANRVDDSSTSIGKRYSRNDELGTPLGITVDFQTLQDRTVTLRDRDSMRQVRVGLGSVVAKVQELVEGSTTWADVESQLPRFEGQELEMR